VPGTERHAEDGSAAEAAPEAAGALTTAADGVQAWQDLFDHAPCGYHSLDATGLFIRMNRTELEWLGYTRDEVIGKMRFSDVITPESLETFKKNFPVFQRQGYIRDLEFDMIRKDGSTFPILLNSTAVRNAEGGYIASRSIVVDITAQRRMHAQLAAFNAQLEQRVAERTRELEAAHQALQRSEEQLRHAQKMEAIGRLAGGIAHDFNNMLSAILTYATLLKSSVPDPLVEDLEQIRLAGERAAGLTRQLLAFSRRQILDPQPVDMNRVVADVERMVSRLIGEHIELRLTLSDPIGLVHADRTQLEQVVLNLVLNARDAMPNGGRLTLETRSIELDDEYAEAHPETTPGTHVLLVVSDTGVGMDADTRARIFEPFFTTKPAGSGTGLGLATVYGIVKQSGGHVWVYSEPGRGTSFKIYLPLLTGDTAAASAPPPHEPVRLTGHETVLLVEDEDVVRRAARSILERRGYAILETRSAAQALAIAEAHPGPIHLLLTDVIMPHTNGRELAGRVAAMLPNVRVLFMSGYTDATVVQNGVLDDTAHHIDKPLTPDALARKVRQVLDAPA
jgi:PAS domain S-box-containing protein